jgi:hypothetical protein
MCRRFEIETARGNSFLATDENQMHTDGMSQMSQKVSFGRVRFWDIFGIEKKPAFLSEFPTTTSGQVAGAHGSQNGKILRR